MSETKVTPNELSTGAAYANVVNDQTTTSSTYADLATVGPSVTVNIGVNGTALVCIGAGIYTTSTTKLAAVSISGATTRAATDTNSLRKDDAAFTVKMGLTYIETGLNPGSTTFKLQYRTTAGTANFFDRTITVVPL